VRLEDDTYEYDWDDILGDIRSQSSFSDQDERVALAALSRLAKWSKVCPAAFHVLSKRDSSGQLLQKGAEIALRLAPIGILGYIAQYEADLPDLLSPAFCVHLRTAYREAPWCDRMLDYFAVRRLLKRCRSAYAGGEEIA
jgi:hypothetical protein